MTKILGLDIGTNSVGWALINLNEFGEKGKIEKLGSRVVPMDSSLIQRLNQGKSIGIDEKGNALSPAANRRQARMARRLKHRYKLRRTKLIQTFKILNWVDSSFPENFKKFERENPDFQFNINDYLSIEEKSIQEAKEYLGTHNKYGQIKVPDDWVVYYLRKKALKEKISIQELARIIYLMNQRRGYKSMRADNTSKEENKIVKNLIIESVTLIEEGDKKKPNTYLIKAEDYKWEVKRHKKPDWEGKEFQFLISLYYDKEGKLKNAPKVPSADDWEKAMVALNNELENSGKHPGEFFFDKLSKDKNYKIRQQVVKREKYKEELKAIWKKQLQLNEELREVNNDKKKLKELSNTFYKNNDAKQKEIEANDLYHLIANDIIYYQRDFKSQKGLVDECRFERKPYDHKRGYKVAPKSSPEFQEFRIWQDIHNLQIFQKEKVSGGKTYTDENVTKEFIDQNVKASLFELLDSKEQVKENQILQKISPKLTTEKYRINLFANRKALKGNETKTLFRKVFKKHSFNGEHLLNDYDCFYRLWHILYSIQGSQSQKGIRKGLKKFNKKLAKNDQLTEPVMEELTSLPDVDSSYAAYSSKAIRKLLPLMRCGKFWSEEYLHEGFKDRLNKIVTGEYDIRISNNTRDQIVKYFNQKGKEVSELNIDDFQGFPVWLACYTVYGKHSERDINWKYQNPQKINVAKLLPNNSLKNPIVEQVIRETLYLVKELWANYGKIDEIHIEMSRELKKSAKEREKIAENQKKNFEEKERIRKLLEELKNGDPNSPKDIEKFRLWKGNGGAEAEEKFNELFNKRNEVVVSKAEIDKYKLWAEQNHKSPYTGNPIPLNQLFTPNFEKEHIIPQSKLKYDGFDNLVIAEAELNEVKDNRLARTFIKENGGTTVEKNGKQFRILSEGEYEELCNRNFQNQRNKLKNLLREDIPPGFISRQANDTRYITRKLGELLYPIAQGKTGKDIVFTTGAVTDELKAKWGLNSIWRDLMKFRFERLEKILNQKLIVPDEEKANEFHFNLPDPNVSLKRIDHRHHALDALVVAATQQEHIRYLNSLNAASKGQLKDIKYKLVKGKIREFKEPWKNFQSEVKQRLEGVIVSHKVDNKVVSKPHNEYLKWVYENGKKVKRYVKQADNPNWWAVRKSMFEEPQGTIYLKEIEQKNIKSAVQIELARNKGKKEPNGKPRDYIYDQFAREQIQLAIEKAGHSLNEAVNYLKNNPVKDLQGEILSRVKVAAFKEYAANRKRLDDPPFDYRKIKGIPYAERTIESCEKKLSQGKLPNNPKKWPIPFLLKKHLDDYNGKPTEAFQGEGLEELHNKAGKKINKVTKYEKLTNAFNLNGKLLKTKKGGIVYFVIYKNLETGRNDHMYTPPLISEEDKVGEERGVINRLINNEPIADEREGYQVITLSPGELVYVPQENEDLNSIDWRQSNNFFRKVYKMVSCSKSTCYFVPHFIADPILPYDRKNKLKGEIGWDNKSEYTLEDNSVPIKSVCHKIEVDQLGRIIRLNNELI